jgi:ribosomal 50S subunit-associated protein YjgA (DUF615 family)
MALHKVRELRGRDTSAGNRIVRLLRLADPSPIHRTVDRVGAEDYAHVVKLEALRRV